MKRRQFGLPFLKFFTCYHKFSFALTVLLVASAPLLKPQERNKYQVLTNLQIREMLNTLESDIKEHYYDPKMHGLDLDERFERARQKVLAAKSQNEALLYVVAAAAALNDSHTHFFPPAAPYGVDYGWLMQAVGDSDCYVTEVRSNSDAAKKGIKPGDRVVSINGIALTRQNLNYVEYGYRVFPQSGLHVVVRSPDANERSLVPMAEVIPGQQLIRHSDMMTWLRNHEHDVSKDRSRYHAEGTVLFWKLPDFLIEPADLEPLVNKTRRFATVVLDLRGNPGGQVSALTTLVSGFFTHDVQIGIRETRKGSEKRVAKTRGEKAFAGALIVLIDSRSSSAAEIFARLVQLEKRGVVLGDRSSGAVMESQFFPHTVEVSPTAVATYGDTITVAALKMSDGNSLENVGVLPDERILPTNADIAQGGDPVMARAAELAGLKMTIQEASKIFPFEWPKEKMSEID